MQGVLARSVSSLDLSGWTWDEKRRRYCPHALTTALILFAAAAIAIATACTSWAYDGSLNWIFATLVMFPLIGFVLRRQGARRLGDFVHSFGLMAAASAVASIGGTMLAGTAFPMADRVLVRADSALFFGFDWRLAVEAARPHESLLALASYAYLTIKWQPVVLLALLAWTGMRDRGAKLVLAWTIALAVTTLIFPFFPAQGGFLFFGYEPHDMAGVLDQAAWLHMGLLDGARSGAFRTLSTTAMGGIVTFPSFHAAAAVLLGWGAWAVPLVRWPALVLNAVMFASSLLIGGHYLVDLAAGGLIAIGSIVAARSWLAQRWTKAGV